MSVNTHAGEYFRQFIHKSNINISLRVFNNFRSLCHFHGRSQMCACRYHRSIHLIYFLPHFQSRTGSYFLDPLHRMLFVTRIYSLRRITGKEVHIEFQARHLFHNRNTFIFRHPRIYRRFINHNITFGNHLSYRSACTIQRR